MSMFVKRLGLVATVAGVVAAAGCSDSFFDVKRPDIVDAETVDPVQDAEVFSRSAFQNLAVAYGRIVVHSAWFTNEMRVGDTYPTLNEFGRRLIDGRNGTHNDEVWRPLSRAVASAEEGMELLGVSEEIRESVHMARLALTSAFSVQLMAETYCEGTIRLSPRMSTDEMLDHAISRFQQARDIADAVGEADMANAARVGLARAYLQKGDKANAIAAATEVPVDFNFEITYADDVANRSRVGNRAWYFSHARESFVVGPEWRAMADAGDTRISYKDAGRLAQDGELQFFMQQKFTSYADPIRLASGLEARYIVAEARGDINEQIDLINERRQASGQPGIFTSTDPQEVLTELMDQKGRDFWLEGKRMGDWRRNPDNVRYILEPGDNYYKPELGIVSNQTCFPVPDQEKDNNPNF